MVAFGVLSLSRRRERGGLARRAMIVAALALPGLAFAMNGPAQGQSSEIEKNLPPGVNLPPELVQSLKQRQGDEARSLPSYKVIPAVRRNGAVSAKPSAVEALFSERAESKLAQFGYDFFESVDSVVVGQQGAIQDHYIMGPGDRVTVDLRGQENATYRNMSVDREGRFMIDDLKPVFAAGRTFGEFRNELEDRVKQAYIATEVYVSLESIRQASITVSGEVNIPGTHEVSGLSRVLDALVLAGGVKKTGSLRNIVIRRNDRTIPIDLYGILSHRGGADDVVLRDGDRIIVPPLGRTVAVTGAVQLPGIFELPAGKTEISAKDLVELAGGVNLRGAYRLTVLRIRPDGVREPAELDSLSSGLVGDSEILFVNPAVNRSVGQVVLAGHVSAGGRFALKQQKTLKKLLPSRDVFDRSPYLLFGLISRRDPDRLLRKIIPFSPLQVVTGEVDLELEDDDIVRVFSVDEVRALGLAVDQWEDRERRGRERRLYRESERLHELDGSAAAKEGQRRGGGAPPEANTVTAPDEEVGRVVSSSLSVASENDDLLRVLRENGRSRETGGASRPALGEGAFPGAADFTHAADALAKELLVSPALISRVLANYRVNVLGAVRLPGYYFVLQGTSLADLVGAAGGADYRAHLGSVEVTATQIDNSTGHSRTFRRTISLNETPMDSVRVQPLYTVRFRQVYSDMEEGTVTVRGEVRSEGAYNILRGETLSSLIKRAGGLTDVAYPAGAIFIRESAARRERRSNERTAAEIETQLVTLRKNVEMNPTQVALIRDILGRLRDDNGLGRISVEADPNVLAARPELDTVLEPGDVIYFPRRPTTIAVTGMVLNPGSYQFRPGHDAADYVKMAGGRSRFADKGRMFVILPDGTSKPLSGSFWSTKSFEIPPGSVIVVPRDLAPFDLGQFATDFTQVLGQLAVTAASVSVIGY